MKTWYKIVFKLNHRWSFSVFSYESEDEKKAKLQRWKDEHVSPYNHIEVIWHGIDEMDFTQKKKRNYEKENYNIDELDTIS